jgi:hypothetical protein
MKALATLLISILLNTIAWGNADMQLPEEVCSVIGANTNQCSEKQVNAKFVDLNNDGVKELITNWGGWFLWLAVLHFQT